MADSSEGSRVGHMEAKQRIVDFIEKRGEKGTWMEEIAWENHISRMTVARYVQALQEIGAIRTEKRGPIKFIYPVKGIVIKSIEAKPPRITDKAKASK